MVKMTGVLPFGAIRQDFGKIEVSRHAGHSRHSMCGRVLILRALSLVGFRGCKFVVESANDGTSRARGSNEFTYLA